MKRKLLIFAGGVVALIFVAAAVFLLIVKPSQEAGTEPTTTTRNEVPAGIKQLETTFNSPNITTQSKALAPGLNEQFRQQGQTPIANGVTMKFDYTSYQLQGDNAAIIEAALSSGERYRVHLVRQSGHWYIWNTEKR